MDSSSETPGNEPPSTSDAAPEEISTRLAKAASGAFAGALIGFVADPFTALVAAAAGGVLGATGTEGTEL